jgi:hypothetical protein
LDVDVEQGNHRELKSNPIWKIILVFTEQMQLDREKFRTMRTRRTRI